VVILIPLHERNHNTHAGNPTIKSLIFEARRDMVIHRSGGAGMVEMTCDLNPNMVLCLYKLGEN
jgi:hypothetical protein